MTDKTNIISTAEDWLGKQEVKDKDELQEFLGINPATTAWCAAFVNSVLHVNGIIGTGSNMARSFLKFGIPTKKPEPGDIVVFSRGKDPIFGHVAFFVTFEDDGIVVLGGNQSDKVCMMVYPKTNLLGFRTY